METGRPGRAWCIGIGLFVPFLSGCDTGEPVVVGFSAGGTFLDAARLAVEDELAAGPISPFDTIFIQESSNRAAPSIRAAEQLVATPGLVAVIGHSNSASSLAASQIYNAHQVVQVAPTSTAVALSEAGPFTFRMVPPDDRQGRFLAETLAQILPPGSRVAVLFVNDDYGSGLRAEFLAETDPGAVTVVLDLPHMEDDVTEPDVEHVLGALESARPDVILWLARPTVLGRLISGIRTRLGDVPFYGGDALSGLRQLPELGPQWNHVFFTDFLDVHGDGDLRRFRDRYLETHGVPAGGPEILTYDATRVVLQGLRAGARTGPELRSFLASLGRERPPVAGISGPIRFDETGGVERGYVLQTPLGPPEP